MTSGHHTVSIVAPDVGVQLSIELYIYFYKYVGFSSLLCLVFKLQNCCGSYN